MKRSLFLVPLLLLPLGSCGALSQLSKASGDISQATATNQAAASDMIGKIGQLFGQLQGTLDLFRNMDMQKVAALLSQLPQLQLDLKVAQQELKAAAPQAYAQADKNSDGKLSASEMLVYLLGGGGAAAAALAKLLASVNAKAAAGDQKQQAEIDEHYDALAELQKQIALLQAQQAPKS